jgi:autotransporter translocation and assembly factor TamB
LDIRNRPTEGASLDLRSTPSYPPDVIMSKILFGKEAKYLTVSEAAQLAQAVASFNRRGYVFSVLNTFQNIGVIDNISFAKANDQSSSLYMNSQTSTQNDINVSAGKYIHDNVYISVNRKEEGASFDVDFSVTPKISIKANTTGEAGISWKYRY